MPKLPVWVIVKPLTVIQLWPETANPSLWPLTVTAAAGAAVKTIGLPEVPDFLIATFSGYVPAATCTV